MGIVLASIGIAVAIMITCFLLAIVTGEFERWYKGRE